MKTQLEINAINICKILQDNNYEAVYAGGCVRGELPLSFSLKSFLFRRTNLIFL